MNRLKVILGSAVLIAAASLAWAQNAPSPDPAVASMAEYLSRVSKLPPNDADARLALAHWARDHEMWSQAADMAEAVLTIDPNNRAAYTVLQEVDDARPLPAQPELESSLKAEYARQFSHDFKTRTSKHFLLCYDTSDSFAVQRAAAMEKVYDAFQFYFTMEKLRPSFLDKRLVSLVFKSRDEYVYYIKNDELGDMTWSSGLYSQRTNRSAFYDDLSSPALADMVKQTDDLHAKIDDLNKQIQQATLAGQTGMVNQITVERNRDMQSLQQLTVRLDNTANINNNSKTLHEAAHQIAFNTGIQTRLVDYPLWFTEGLACSFEMEDAMGRRGPAVLNYGRIAYIKDALKNNTLIPLEPFIGQREGKMDEAALNIFYAQGWALFHYLYKYNRPGMEKFLIAYNAHRPIIAISPDERKRLFTDAFGPDIDGLEKKFLAYLKSLPARAS